jgi:hypothetical protein
MSGTPELINRYVYLSLVAIGGASSRTPSPQFDPIYRQRDVSVGTIARAVHCARPRNDHKLAKEMLEKAHEKELKPVRLRLV